MGKYPRIFTYALGVYPPHITGRMPESFGKANPAGYIIPYALRSIADIGGCAIKLKHNNNRNLSEGSSYLLPVMETIMRSP
ncbi:hypothetical protein AVEN_223203-1 [Araneus ventricosus]|uniref:Uncharacterized protein n=1 Tax=Araneus ventricosus TaxID=182803 RepID=A0A4Y2SDQ0_ARAVE|nr:hypothetical protein AVEN_223203-1 [Araneus ventricosus]